MITQRIEWLRSFARAVDRAREHLLCNDAREAISIWRGLASGHWSIVCHFDADERRFLVVRKRDPDASPKNALTTRERQVVTHTARGHALKLIAHELGVSVSTVNTHLRRATKKLGVSSRTDLILIARATALFE